MTRLSGKKIKEQQKTALLNNIEAVGLGRQGQRERFSSPSSGNDQQTSPAVSSATTISISPPVSATSFIESMTNRLIDAIGSSNTTGEDELKQLQMEALRAQIRASNAQEAFYNKQK